MRWRDIKTDDDRDLYFWERENEALQLAQESSARGSLEESEQWLDEANRNRQLRWPKDRPFEKLHIHHRTPRA